MKVTLGDSIQIFFKNIFAAMGVFFTLFSLPFLLVFGASANFDSFLYTFQATKTGQGLVDYIDYTNYSVNEESVLEFGYTYTHPKTNVSYRGVSYDVNYDLNVDDRVTVEYIENKPHKSRIEGMSSAPMSWWILLLISIFPMVGLIMVYVAFKAWLKKIRVLRNGIVGKGKFNRIEPTNTTVNDKMVYKIIFDYEVSGKQYQTFAESTNTEKFTDEEFEPLVYHKYKPQMAIMVDDLPYYMRRSILGDI